MSDDYSKLDNDTLITLLVRKHRTWAATPASQVETCEALKTQITAIFTELNRHRSLGDIASAIETGFLNEQQSEGSGERRTQ